jgi:hypothetical protein
VNIKRKEYKELEDEGITISQYVGNCLPIYMA